MNAPVSIAKCSEATLEYLENLAKDLSDEEHIDLAYRRERIADTWKRESFDEDYGWRDDGWDYFDANRNYFMEKAREALAAEVAA